MKFKKLIAALGFAVAALHAYAAPALVPGGVSIIEDDDKEYVKDASGAFKTSGSLAVGDVLWAVVRFNNVLTSTNSIYSPLGAGNALYGISAIEVSSISATTATFKPNAGFELTYGAGAMAALFTGPTDLDMACATIAACETAATSGTHWMTVGFNDTDDFWTASGADLPITVDLSLLALAAATDKFAVANYALSILKNDTGYDFAQQFCLRCALVPGGNDLVDIIGSGDILGGAGLLGGYIARSDFDFQLVTRVPEPGTLALLGASLLAAGGASVRRRKAK